MTEITKKLFKIPGQSISWVGECPWTDTLCFGGEDGKLIISRGCPEIGKKATTNFFPFPLATDAINAVAFADNMFALSSRNEIVVGRRQTQNNVDSLDTCSHEFRGGAHGVVASQTGAFLAPIGDLGLLVLKYDSGQIEVETFSHEDFPFNSYKLVRLGTGPQGEEVFASAGRGDGLLAFRFARDADFFSSTHHSFEAHDIVDVCPLNDPRYPFAVACISRSGVVFLIRDVLEDHTLFRLNYGGNQGVSYTLLSARGHLFLLTDRELVAFPNVAFRFARGESPTATLKIACFPVNVSEAFLWRNQAILLIEEDYSVAQLEIEDLIDATEPTRGQAGLGLNGHPHQGSTSETSNEIKPVEKSALDVKMTEVEYEIVPVPSGEHTNDSFNLILTHSS